MRLDALKAEYGHDLLIDWRAFLLRPEPQRREVDAFRRYTTRWNAPGGPGDQESSVEFRVWSGESTPPTHSMPSAIAGKAAMRFGAEAFDRYHHAAMRAYFTDNRDISDQSVLVAIARSVDIDADAFAATLRDEGAALQQLVTDEYVDAIDNGIHAVPTVVVHSGPIDDAATTGFPIPGAQDLDTYRKIIERHRNRP